MGRCLPVLGSEPWSNRTTQAPQGFPFDSSVVREAHDSKCDRHVLSGPVTDQSMTLNTVGRGGDFYWSLKARIEKILLSIVSARYQLFGTGYACGNRLCTKRPLLPLKSGLVMKPNLPSTGVPACTGRSVAFLSSPEPGHAVWQDERFCCVAGLLAAPDTREL